MKKTIKIYELFSGGYMLQNYCFNIIEKYIYYSDIILKPVIIRINYSDIINIIIRQLQNQTDSIEGPLIK